MHPEKDAVASEGAGPCAMCQKPCVGSPLLSSWSVNPDPKPTEATCTSFPAVLMTFGSGLCAEEDVGFPMELLSVPYRGLLVRAVCLIY